MAQQIINYGNVANDGTGDPLRDAFIKVDDNFNQIWAAGPVGSNVSILNNTVGVTNTNGNLILSPNGIGIIQTNRHLYPRLDNTYDLGYANLRYRSIFVGSGGMSIDGNLVLSNIANLQIPGGENGYVIQTNGAGVLSWAAQSGSGNGNPGGANTQVQFNDGGLFGGTTDFTFNKVSGQANIGSVNTGNVYTDIIAINRDENPWIIHGNTILAPSGGRWSSYKDSLDDYISSATNGYLNLQTFDSTSALATELHMEHGLVQINIHDGVVNTWEFNVNGSFTAPGNISGNYIIGNGSLLTDLPGGVIQGNVPPPSPNDTTLWWDDVTGRLYVWYDDGSGLQWVDAAPAGPPNAYGNANVSLYMASGTNSAGISTTGNVTAAYLFGDGSTISNLSVGGGTKIVNGNSYANVETVDGNVVIAANGPTWTFGTDGNLQLPIGSITGAGNIIGPGNISYPFGPGVVVSANVDDSYNSYFSLNLVANSQQPIGYIGTASFSANASTGLIFTTDGAGNGYSWEFGSDGTTVFPNYTFPRDDGNGGEVLTTDGSGTIFWGTGGSGAANKIYNGTSYANIASSSGNLEININTNSWNFNDVGQIVLPSGGTLGYAGMGWTGLTGANGSPVEITTKYGSGNAATQILSNTDGSIYIYTVPDGGDQNTWKFDSAGNLTFPIINGTQQQVSGTQQTIYGDPFPASSINSTANVTIWTADSDIVSGAKMTLKVVHYDTNTTSWQNTEMMDIMMAKTYPDGTPAFTITNRIKTNSSYTNVPIDVTLNGSNVMQVISSTPDGIGNNAYWTYSVTSFNQTFD